ncbi:hypothetical protein HanPI659440_Chr08g0295061 [Helianthus annuus]|nr:hypothetical protein HanPI659440_Chr08g0295061 [Helianthus annuus]
MCDNKAAIQISENPFSMIIQNTLKWIDTLLRKKSRPGLLNFRSSTLKINLQTF